jgi:DNA uptake protein ComE-like DNA-binding protein
MFLGAEDNAFDINSATPSLLQFVVEPKDADKIVKKRPFASIEDAVKETQIPERFLKRFKCEPQNVRSVRTSARIARNRSE